MNTSGQRPVLAGVLPDSPAKLVETAIEYARRFGTNVEFVFADASQLLMDQLPDGSMVTIPIDPDAVEGRLREAEDHLRSGIRSAVEAMGDRAAGVDWDIACVNGDPARALARLARERDAEMIVVGTRDGFMGGLIEFFTGSVAARLSHWQPRPVVVVPLSPSAPDGPLPWQRA